MARKKPQNIKARGGRFGPGKVHYSTTGAQPGHLRTLCGLVVQGDLVDAKDNPATCKRCFKAVP